MLQASCSALRGEKFFASMTKRHAQPEHAVMPALPALAPPPAAAGRSVGIACAWTAYIVAGQYAGALVWETSGPAGLTFGHACRGMKLSLSNSVPC